MPDLYIVVPALIAMIITGVYGSIKNNDSAYIVAMALYFILVIQFI